MKTNALPILLAAALVLGMQATACALGIASASAAPVAGPAAPAAGSAGSQNDGDFAARVAMEQQEAQAVSAVEHQPDAAAVNSANSSPGAAAAQPASSAPGAATAQPASSSPAATASLGAILGLGLSSALLALGLLFGWSQRRHLLPLLRPGRASAAGLTSGAALAAALASRLAHARGPGSAPTGLRSALAGPRSAPTGPGSAPTGTGKAAKSPFGRPGATLGDKPAAEAESLRRLALELQQIIGELRAERAQWEKEWEQREVQWFRAISSRVQTGPSPTTEPSGSVARDATSAPRELPSAEGSGASDEPGILTRVEQLLQQGLPAEEISRRLHVGLREIQWMMRLGTLETR